MGVRKAYPIVLNVVVLMLSLKAKTGTNVQIVERDV